MNKLFKIITQPPIKTAWMILAVIYLSSLGAAQDLKKADAEKAIEYLSDLLASYPIKSDAVKMRQLIKQKLAHGEYNELANRQALAKTLTADLRSIRHDFHLGVQYSAEASTADAAHNLSNPEVIKRLKKTNYGFAETRIMEGNVGFLKITALNTPEVAKDQALNALGFLQHTDALIIDLRGNLGGEPEMVRLISSAFFAKKTHLNTLHYTDGRDRAVEEIWTDPDLVNGINLHDKPIYILTNFYVASGAEDLAYSLQAQGRATIVGKKTAGAAHPGTSHYLEELQLNFSMPHGYVVNPVTGKDWEGTGISPDVKSKDAHALDTALSLAWQDIGYTARDVE